MPTTPVSAPSQPVARPRAPEETGLASNFETFLQLLTTQLKNQDPLSPMDTERFTSQLVQFSAVEQALKTNRQLEQLVSLTRTSAASAALGMVGREVRVDGSRMLVDAQGGATIYELPERAASVTVRIFDADGRLIHSADRPLPDHRHRARRGRPPDRSGARADDPHRLARDPRERSRPRGRRRADRRRGRASPSHE
jgi:flagellar basal-body rod modification protein FlgD